MQGDPYFARRSQRKSTESTEIFLKQNVLKYSNGNK